MPGLILQMGIARTVEACQSFTCVKTIVNDIIHLCILHTLYADLLDDRAVCRVNIDSLY